MLTFTLYEITTTVHGLCIYNGIVTIILDNEIVINCNKLKVVQLLVKSNLIGTICTITEICYLRHNTLFTTHILVSKAFVIEIVKYHCQRFFFNI